jgi:hypothetical protein
MDVETYSSEKFMNINWAVEYHIPDHSILHEGNENVILVSCYLYLLSSFPHITDHVFCGGLLFDLGDGGSNFRRNSMNYTAGHYIPEGNLIWEYQYTQT